MIETTTVKQYNAQKYSDGLIANLTNDFQTDSRFTRFDLDLANEESIRVSLEMDKKYLDHNQT